MPMGYGTIASNGVAHGSKAQTIESLKTQNLYTKQEEVRFFTPWSKPLKHLNKHKSVIICSKENFKPHIETPKPNNEDITQLGREVTSIGLLEGLPFTFAIIQEPTTSFEPRISPQTPTPTTIYKTHEKYDNDKLQQRKP